MTYRDMTKQEIGRVGLDCLASSLKKEKFKLAFPEGKGTGIDLFAWRASFGGGIFPIQFIAFSQEGFYTNRQYLEIPGLFIIYGWQTLSASERNYICLPYGRAEAIVDEFCYSRKDGVYFIGKISKALREVLETHRVEYWQTTFPKG